MIILGLAARSHSTTISLAFGFMLRAPMKDIINCLATTEFRGSLMELPRKSLDFAYTQRVFQHMQLKLSVQNLLNQPIEMAIDNNYTWKYEPQYEITDPDPMTNITKGGDNIASSFNPGRHFILTFSYSL